MTKEYNDAPVEQVANSLVAAVKDTLDEFDITCSSIHVAFNPETGLSITVK